MDKSLENKILEIAKIFMDARSKRLTSKGWSYKLLGPNYKSDGIWTVHVQAFFEGMAADGPSILYIDEKTGEASFKFKQ